MTTNTHSPHTRHIGRGPIILIAIALLAGICAAATPIGTGHAVGSSGSYGWPVKPFNRQHPIRGYFGDPRTVFTGRPSFRNLMEGTGTFTFHFGVDVAAADGTAVYPVRSGTATVRSGTTVGVSSDNGFATQYWHIVPAVRTGQNVVAYRTVLGHVARGAHHVHFTELDEGRPVNPLAPGHLAPYADRTPPKISSIWFRRGPAQREIAPEFLRGRIIPIVDAYDMPALPVRSPAYWRNLPVSPALLTWHMEQVATGRVVVSRQTAFDVRSSLPSNRPFWSVYARGSHQNMLQFTTRRYGWQPGVYLYRLTRGPFDTRRLGNGVYRLVVTATDTRGNRSSSSQVFTVLN